MVQEMGSIRLQTFATGLKVSGKDPGRRRSGHAREKTIKSAQSQRRMVIRRYRKESKSSGQETAFALLRGRVAARHAAGTIEAGLPVRFPHVLDPDLRAGAGA